MIVRTDGDITDSAFIPGLGGLPEEIATFCKVDDPKKPTFVGAPEFSVVQFCPEGTDPTMDQVPEVTTGSVTGLLVRIVFDELLNPDVETLIDTDTGGPCVLTGDTPSVTCDGSLATTQPVTVDCGPGNAAVAYDGYYIPNGNLVSYPPGPSLVITIAPDTVATSAECSVTLKDTIVDKTGNSVPPEQRGTGGAYKFKVAGLDITGTTPGDGEDLAADAPVDISFNANLDLTTVSAADISVHDDTANTNVPLDFSQSGGADIIFAPSGGGGTWTIGDGYTVTVDAAATINDLRGGPYVGGGTSFTFNAVAP